MITNSSQLVQAAQRGDINAVTDLYTASYKAAYLTAKSIVRNQNDAEVLVKDSYLEAFYNINTIPDANRFDKWFNTVVDKKAKEYLLKSNPDLFPQSISAAASFWNDENPNEQTMISPQLASDAMNIIYALPENQKLILIMYYNQELSAEEIADTLALSADEVKGTLFNAKQAVERGIAPINTLQAPTAAVLSASFNQAAQTCIAPQGQIADIISTLTGGANAQAAAPAAVPPTAPEQNIQPDTHGTILNGTPQSTAAIKSGMSKGTKLALIIGGAAIVVIAAVIVIFLVFFSDPKSGEVVATQPSTVVETQPTEGESESETETQTQSNSSTVSGKIYDSAYALPGDYKYKGASFDSKKGFDSGFGLDEKDTIKALEELPEIKEIVSDKDAYVRYTVEQRNFSSRDIYTYYSGDNASYSVFIDTDENGCQAPNRLNLIFTSSGDTTLAELRETAKKILELTKLDSTLINALLYSDMEDLNGIETSNDVGTIYPSNELSEDKLNISISFYPGYSKKAPEGIKAKYYEDDISKHFDVNKLFNNPDIDFSKDLTTQGLSKLTAVDYAKKITDEYYTPSVSYTTDQSGKITDLRLNITDDFSFDSKDGEIESCYLNVSYSQDNWGNTEEEITLQYIYGTASTDNYSNCAKLAAEQLKFFDKDLSLDVKELTLSNDNAGKELEINTKLSPNGKAELDIDDNGSSVTYTLSWEIEE